MAIQTIAILTTSDKYLMLSNEIIVESAAHELAKKLPSLSKHNYGAMDQLLHRVAKKHGLSKEALQDLFFKRFKRPLDPYAAGKLDETDEDELDIADEVKKFAEWTGERLNLLRIPKIELSYDTQDAQDNHHTGRHVQGEDLIWVYVKNRNLVDILRTVFHELVHIRQDEIGMIKPGDSYPGSPIEVMADMLAGKYIKIYGEQNHHIFQ
jgi:hypothetical protein